MDTQDKLLAILNHAFEPVKIAKLMELTGMENRPLRKLMTSLVIEKISLIFGDPETGYQIIRTQGQYEHAIADLASREARLRERRQAIEEMWEEKENVRIGQAHLEFEKERERVGI